MKNQYYAIFDNVSQLYMTPVLFQNEKQAIRWFKDVVNNERENMTIYNNPNDFELWGLGTYDNATGDLSAMKLKVANGGSLKEEK